MIMIYKEEWIMCSCLDPDPIPFPVPFPVPVPTTFDDMSVVCGWGGYIGITDFNLT